MPASSSTASLRGVALQAEIAGGARLRDLVLVLLDHHEAGGAGLQRLGELDPDAAEAADDDVVFELVDLGVHAPVTQNLLQRPAA